MLEAAIAFRQQAEEKARLKREQEKEAAVRSQQKEKVMFVGLFVFKSLDFCFSFLTMCL